MAVLRFRLFGFPVSIQPGFWLLALMFSLMGGRGPAQGIAMAALIALSVLAHELGHAVVARRFGKRPQITLHFLGGVTSWTAMRPLGRLRGVLVAVAGPGAGFALGLAALGALVASGATTLDPTVQPEGLTAALAYLAMINLFWSAINLLPVLPFDGGQVMASALGPERRKLTAAISLVAGLGAALVLFDLNFIVGAVLFGWAGIANFVAAQRPAPPPPSEEQLDVALEQARAALSAEAYPQAAAIGQVVLAAATGPNTAKAALEVMAWAALGLEDNERARACLSRIPAPIQPDAYLAAHVMEANGDVGGAAALLHQARHAGDERPELTALLVRLELEQSHGPEAADLALAVAGEVADADLRKVVDTLLAADDPESAFRVASGLFGKTCQPEDAVLGALCLASSGQFDTAMEWLETARDAGLVDERALVEFERFTELVALPRFERLREAFGRSGTA